MKLTPNFSVAEFACKCGCGSKHIAFPLVENLQKLRDAIAKPIIVNSGVRCAKHNRSVGGVRSSQHVLGTAADIRVKGMSVHELHQAVLDSGLFTGVGFYPISGFVHVDVRKGRLARWSEPREAKYAA